MAESQLREAQLVQAPLRPAITSEISIFLAGTTSREPGPHWRETVTIAISHLPVTIFNPLRVDWDSSWPEDITFLPFREQVEWELDMQERADVVVVYFGPGTVAPISLLELGLSARSGKALAVCHKDYMKRGNVQSVCRRFGIDFLDSEDDWARVLVERLERLLIKSN